MDGRVRATVNIFTERLWRMVKYEEVYLYDYEMPREARQQLGRQSVGFTRILILLANSSRQDKQL